ISKQIASDRIFFVRYFLGGPHLRIRVRCLPDHQDLVADLVREHADRFLAAWPSEKLIDPVDIARANIGIIRNDPSEHDDNVYPDNSFRIFPFQPEIDRYGGEELMPHSLDFFCVSSLAALDLLQSCGAWNRSRLLAEAARLLFAQAVGFAGSLE